MDQKTFLFVHDVASAVGSEYGLDMIVRNIEFLFFEVGLDLLHLLKPIGCILQEKQDLVPNFLLVLWRVVNQGKIILAFGVAAATVNIKVGADLVLAMVRGVFIVLDLLDLRQGRLVVSDGSEADSVELLTQSSLRLLKIFNVDLSLIDRGSRRVEVIDSYLETRSCLGMREPQIDPLGGLRGVALQLIDDELAHILANVRRQARRFQTPEEIFGGKFVKYTHSSQINIS